MTSADPARRIVGTGYHVADLDRSLGFYTRILGMIETTRYEFPGITEVLLKYVDDEEAPAIVLVHRDDEPGPFELGNAYGRLIVTVPDVRLACEQIAAEGLRITMEPFAYEEAGTVIAMAVDPDGFALELLEVALTPSAHRGDSTCLTTTR
jgi:lactoylglutathione lyase